MKKYLILLLGVLFMPLSVYASTTIDISADKTNISSGDTIKVTTKITSDSPIGSYEYTLDYDNSKLELTSGTEFNMGTAYDDNTKSFSKTFNFKVLDSSKSEISVKSYAVLSYGFNKEMDVKVNPLTIGSGINGNTNNKYLSSLSVTDYDISPKFDKDINKYYLVIDKEVNEIEIKATVDDESSSITGTGKKEVKNGENKFEIIVTSSRGDENIYTLIVTVGDKNPIKVFINDKEYTVIKNTSSVFKKDNFEEKIIKIDNIEIKSLYNKTTDLTLVGLNNSKNESDLYVYDKEFIPFVEIKNKTTTVVPLFSDKVHEGFDIYSENINDKEVSCYKKSIESNTCIIYGVNLNTGDRKYYVYDLENKLLSDYNDEFKLNIKDKIDMKILTISVIGILLIAVLITLIIIRNKKKRKISKRKRIK